MKKHTDLQYLLTLALVAGIADAFVWYYDVYVHWRPKLYPFAIAALALGVVVLTLFALCSREERKPLALAWKTALSLVIFLGTLIGVSAIVNNVIGHNHMAKEAAAVAIPLAAAQIVVLCVICFRAQCRENRRAGSVFAIAGLSIAALALAVAVLNTGQIFGFGKTRPSPETSNEQTEIGGIRMEKIRDLAIYDREDEYNTMPSIARTKDGAYLLAFRYAPDRRASHDGLITHTDPESATYVLKSTDGCETWSEPQALRWLPGYANQDPVLNVLSDGTVLMTVFFWRYFDVAIKPALQKIYGGWGAVYDAFDGLATVCAGSYAYISRDGGDTWEGPQLISESYALRGRCAQLPDGTVLAPLYGVTDGSQAVIFASRDQGVTWEPYSYAAGPLGKNHGSHEPSLFRTQSGRIFCFIRTDDEMYYCVSGDDGRSFGEPVATGLPGSVPYDALQLPSGNVYLTYGHRGAPYGIRALLLDSECNGISPGREVILRNDGLGGDISYTSSVLLPDGDILTVYYYYTEGSGQRRYIAGTVMREAER